jgi:hypothetical protein
MLWEDREDKVFQDRLSSLISENLTLCFFYLSSDFREDREDREDNSKVNA